jgi:hypothetical protein
MPPIRGGVARTAVARPTQDPRTDPHKSAFARGGPLIRPHRARRLALLRTVRTSSRRVTSITQDGPDGTAGGGAAHGARRRTVRTADRPAGTCPGPQGTARRPHGDRAETARRPHGYGSARRAKERKSGDGACSSPGVRGVRAGCAPCRRRAGPRARVRTRGPSAHDVRVRPPGAPPRPRRDTGHTGPVNEGGSGRRRGAAPAPLARRCPVTPAAAPAREDGGPAGRAGRRRRGLPRARRGRPRPAACSPCRGMPGACPGGTGPPARRFPRGR